MPSKNLQGARSLLKAKRFNVVRTKGPSPREIVVHPGAAVILPLLKKNTVVMIRNERVATGGTLWELPCGTLEPPEKPLVCAARELAEETAYRAGKLTRLCSFYSSPGICTEVIHAFLAEDLKLGEGQDLDVGEKVEVEIVPLKRAMKMVEENRIRDGKTITTLLFYQAFGKGRG